MSVRETDPQIRYISNLSQIPIDKIKQIRFSIKEASNIIKKLLDEKTKKEIIHQLLEMIEKEKQDKEKRMQREPSNTDPNFTIIEDESDD